MMQLLLEDVLVNLLCKEVGPGQTRCLDMELLLWRQKAQFRNKLKNLKILATFHYLPRETSKGEEAAPDPLLKP